MITFGRVAAAILMLKTLEMFWAYGFTVAPDGKVMQTLIILTIAWLAFGGVVWAFAVWFEAEIRDRTGIGRNDG